MLKIENLTKYYNKTLAVENLSLEIEPGDIFGFIGPNGAGKSTTIRCVMDLINKNSGIILFNEKEVTRNSFELKEEIGYLPSEIHLYDDMTVKQMLNYSASFYKKDCSKKLKYLVSKLKIDENKKCDELSLGNIKKVGIALALMHNPKFIILDEPTSGLDPLMQEVFYEIIKKEAHEGKTIFFSTHILSEIKKICKRIAIIKEGKIVKVSNVDDLGEDILVVTLYSKEIEKILKVNKLEVIKQKENMIRFVNREDVNKILKEISKYNIDKILIEEPTVEEIFMEFYK